MLMLASYTAAPLYHHATLPSLWGEVVREALCDDTKEWL